VDDETGMDFDAIGHKILSIAEENIQDRLAQCFQF
jgi:hypothetical protein